MASPQLEEGYTPIANELLEAMAKHDFGFSNGQIFSCILRKTYGWGKSSDKISISQLCEATGLSKRTVVYTLKNLEFQNKITVKRSIENNEKQVNEISIQKDYSKWIDSSFAPPYAKLRNQARISSAKRRGSAKLCKKVVQSSVKNVQSFAHTKETITKETIQKKTTSISLNGSPKEIVDYYLTIKGFLNENVAGEWGRLMLAGKKLLQNTKDIGLIKKGIDWLNKNAKEKGYSWTLETLGNKKWAEFMAENEKPIKVKVY